MEVTTYPLFDHPPYTLALATKMAGSGRVRGARSAARALRDSALGERAAGARRWPRRASLPFITTLHGTDITLVGNDRSYLPITRFSIEQSDGVTAISNYLRDRTSQEFDIKRPIEVIPNFVNCDYYMRSRRSGRAREMGAERRADSDAPLEFSSREARHRRGRDFRARARRRFPRSW